MLITNLAGRRRLHRRAPGAVTRNDNPDHSKDSRPLSVQLSDQHARSYCMTSRLLQLRSRSQR